MNKVLLFVLMACLGYVVFSGSIYIESENTMGVHHIDGVVGNQVIPVPWTKLGEPDVAPVQPITISNLISVASLKLMSDTMKPFNKDSQLFENWSWANFTWVYQAGVVPRLNADSTPIERGEALWLKLTNKTDLYLIGQVSTNALVSRLAYGQTETKDSFLTNPYDVVFDVLGRIDGAVLGDRINLVTATNSVHYSFEIPTGATDPVWGRYQMVKEESTTPWGAVVTREVQKFVPSENILVSPGVGLWYTSVPVDGNREPAPQIRW